MSHCAVEQTRTPAIFWDNEILGRRILRLEALSGRVTEHFSEPHKLWVGIWVLK
jgi:hypothetical protein